MGKTTKAKKSPQTNINNRDTGHQAVYQDTSHVLSVSPLAQIVQLQRAVGNQAVVQMLRHAASEGVIQRNGGNNQEKRIRRKRKRGEEQQTEEDAAPPTKKAKVNDEDGYEFDIEMEDVEEEQKAEHGEQQVEGAAASAAEEENFLYDDDDDVDMMDVEEEQKAEHEDEAETEDVNEENDSFWTRLVVRATTPVKAKMNSFKVHKVFISPERRMTRYGNRQGNHLVAWSLTYRYWNEQLSDKPLPEVLSMLKKWIQSDQRADYYRNKTLVENNPTNTQKRARALVLINKMENEELNANEFNHLLEQAISLFVEANQASYFTVQGTKNVKGRGEAQAQKDLVEIDEEIGEISSKIREISKKKNLENQKEKLEKERMEKLKENEEKVKENALKLIDLDQKNLDLVTFQKVISTWHEMLIGRYSNLKEIFDKIYQEKLDEYKATHQNNESQNKNVNLKKKPPEELTGEWDPSTAGSAAIPTKVLTAVGPMDNEPLSASQVRIEYVEMPGNLRAKTQIGSRQGSHTLAWTFLKTSLMEMFKNCTLKEFLERLAKLIKHDLDSLDNNVNDELRNQLTALQNNIQAALIAEANLQHPQHQRPLHQWILDVNDLFKKYVELNQLLPTSTYSLSENPIGRGEGAANRANKKAREPATSEIDNLQQQTHEQTISDSVYKNLRDKYTKYIDAGFFYRDYIAKIRNTLIQLAKENAPNPDNPPKVLTRRLTKKGNQNIIQTLNLNNLQAVLDELYNKEEKMLKKVFGDFYLFLEYFHPAFYQRFKNDTKGKEEFVQKVLIAPLNEDVGNIIWNICKRFKDEIEDAIKATEQDEGETGEEGENDKFKLIKQLKEIVKGKSLGWSAKLLPSPQSQQSPAASENQAAAATPQPQLPLGIE